MVLAQNQILQRIKDSPTIYACRGQVLAGTGLQGEGDKFLKDPHAYLTDRGFRRITGPGPSQIYEQGFSLDAKGIRSDVGTIVLEHDKRAIDIRGNEKALDTAKLHLGLPIHQL